MVSGSARPHCRPHGRWFRRWRRGDRGPDPRCHPFLWVRDRVPVVRPRSGPRRAAAVATAAGTQAGRGASCGAAAPVAAGIHPVRDAAFADFLSLYLMIVMVAASGLMATAQIAPIAKDVKLADQEVVILFITATTLSAALVVDNILNGLARPFFGWISDHIGRENTMAMVFTLGAGAYWGLGTIGGGSPYAFILMAGLVFFTWGEIFSLFPATCTDTYGSQYATTNAGLLYT